MLSPSDKFRKRRYGKVTTLSVAEGKNGRKEVYTVILTYIHISEQDLDMK